ncbi:site-specific integrase [Mesorhizobium sp. M6A.T.Ce.TU.002.03.1.1]|uniref:tyrosine-type recombinase/integrase n=1 Tax=Mesorhizobium sp. M6A.T.Ce.TU.002.03.1.1 TaxID=2496782 RepID=UPI000FCC2BE9|nr:site-specific integrase [Mesorhizobium sp. M6A.T.Ce.TU.002.03.1.1]RUU46620.1 site-specific integrase [Mesorhizobium sp. M6A.T.Ce.TU.002.03.1.1]
MARALHKLSVRAFGAIDKPGRHGDGGGLYLNVSGDGRRRWIFLYRREGKLKEMGLGSARDVTLAKAREAASAARAVLNAGGDPLRLKRAKELEAANPSADDATPLFGVFADSLIEQIKGGFRNAKHVAQWKMTLGDTYCRAIRKMPVDQIATADVLGILQPIWLSKAETAGRIRGRIERVLDAAKASGYREGENPARLRGHLALLLPARPKLQRGHHPAMPYPAVSAFIQSVGKLDSISADALSFLILTVARTGEVTGATWREIDAAAKIWTVPAERMKAGREHRVPLSDAAMTLLRRMAEIAPEGPTRAAAFVFPGARSDRPLSVMAIAMCLRGLDPSATVHGFRSSFRDWAGNETRFAREVIEQALAHRVGDSTELAYRRSDALDKRRKLMEAWAGFVTAKPSANVVAFPINATG